MSYRWPKDLSGATCFLTLTHASATFTVCKVPAVDICSSLGIFPTRGVIGDALRKPLNRRFIAVEGIYQYSGDLAPLDEIYRLKDKYK